MPTPTQYAMTDKEAIRAEFEKKYGEMPPHADGTFNSKGYPKLTWMWMFEGYEFALAGRSSLADAGQVPGDPMDWPLPCDVTVGHGTMRKGVPLRTLVNRMKVLYGMAIGADADEVANRPMEERRALLDKLIASLPNPKRHTEAIELITDALSTTQPKDTPCPPIGEEGWRDIESAPKDGSEFFAFIPSYGEMPWSIEIGQWCISERFEYQPEGELYRKVLAESVGYWNCNHFTHWMPLPQPPQANAPVRDKP